MIGHISWTARSQEYFSSANCMKSASIGDMELNYELRNA